MSALARRFARVIWFWVLWFMRRPWIKRWQRRAFWDGVPPERRDQTWAGFRKQNAWARKYGQPIIAFLVSLVMASLAIQLAYYGLITLVDSGFLIPLHQ